MCAHRDTFAFSRCIHSDNTYTGLSVRNVCLPDDQDTTMLSEKNKIADCFIVLETSMFEKFELFHTQQMYK